LITVPKRHGQADRQTYGPTDDMQSHNRALRKHREVKTPIRAHTYTSVNNTVSGDM